MSMVEVVVVEDEEDNALCGDLVHWNDLVVLGPNGCPRHTSRNPRKLVSIFQCECMM